MKSSTRSQNGKKSTLIQVIPGSGKHMGEITFHTVISFIISGSFKPSGIHGDEGITAAEFIRFMEKSRQSGEER